MDPKQPRPRDSALFQPVPQQTHSSVSQSVISAAGHLWGSSWDLPLVFQSVLDRVSGPRAGFGVLLLPTPSRVGLVYLKLSTGLEYRVSAWQHCSSSIDSLMPFCADTALWLALAGY